MVLLLLLKEKNTNNNNKNDNAILFGIKDTGIGIYPDISSIQYLVETFYKIR